MSHNRVFVGTYPNTEDAKTDHFLVNILHNDT